MGLPEGDVCMGKVASPPMTWWLEKYPRLKESGMAKELGMIECLQRPGDTIYVPAGELTT